MRIKLNYCKHPLLKKIIHYFVFVKKDGAIEANYTSFPNTNACISIYKQNKIFYSKNSDHNICKLLSSEQMFSSRLWAFHQKPFNVSMESPVEQFCIIFHPSGIRWFTDIPYDELLESDHVFEDIFGDQSYLLSEVFNTSDLPLQQQLVEDFLLKRIQPNKEAAAFISAVSLFINQMPPGITIEQLAKKMYMHPSSLYRYFTLHIGQKPKSFLRTVQFRNIIEIFQQRTSLSISDIAMEHGFTDLAHFSNSFKQLSGLSPSEWTKRVHFAENEIALTSH